ncbi:MAG TPA: sugar ABC transporter permease [Ktedonobacteraceae bacterium]|nr:sugar ABC transporter permease [Ktedonobacteraceae bacterium]
MQQLGPDGANFGQGTTSAAIIPQPGLLRGRRQFKHERRLALQAYAFLLPSFIGLLAFSLIPILAVAVLSLFRWGLIGQPTFIGLGNYAQMFSSSSFWHSLLLTLYYVLLNIPMQTIFALLLALLLNQKIPGRGIFRTLFVVPWMATAVAMGIVWQWIFDPQYGTLNTFLGLFHIAAPAWLSSTTWALPAIAAVNIWQYTGYNMLFFLAGLQGIPPDFYEAASLDGANPVQQFFAITLPLLTPTLFFVLVTDVIGSAQVFDTVYVMTQGGPGDATSVLNFNIFRQAFEFFHAGYASALSMVLFAILLIITLLQALFFRSRTVYDLS